MDTTRFDAGTLAECNRCNRHSPLPKACAAHLEAQRETATGWRQVWRLETMAMLDCGHMDGHWVITESVEKQ